MRSTIIVTGGTGFLGRHLVFELLKSGARLHLLLRKSPPQEVLESWPQSDSLEIHEADISDLGLIRKIFQSARPERIFHLAGKTDPSRTFEVAQECLAVNARGTLNLLEASAGQKISSFVFTSTTEIYGNNRTPFEESQRPDPPSPYAISKLAAENFCLYFHKTRQVPATVLRMSSCYGPYLKKPRLVAAAFSACFNPGETLNMTSGRQKRDFLYVGDAVRGLLAAAASPKAPGEVINLAGKSAYTVQEMVKAICRTAGSEPAIRWSAIPDRPNENKSWRSSIKKAKKILGWQPQTNLKEGLQATCEWWKKETVPV